MTDAPPRLFTGRHPSVEHEIEKLYGNGSTIPAMVSSKAMKPTPDFIPYEPKRDLEQEIDALVHRFDGNFRLIEKAIADQNRQKAAKRPRRTGSAARMDPDDYRAGRVILALVVVFAAAMGAASFFGQLGFAPYTQLPEYMWWVIPVAIDLPLTVLGWVALIFRRRKQSAKRTWAVMFLLTGISSTINVTHVLDGASVLAGQALTFPDLIGCVTMGAIPFLIVYSWEEITKLLVRPMGEKREETPATPSPKPPVVKRRPTPRKK